MMKSLLSLLCLPLFAAAQSPTWLRYPAISPDGQTVVFTYQGDLYKAPTAGGQAIALTLHEAQDMMPVWSADGRQIAFASDRYGNFDVFAMPIAGGQPKRLTFHSAGEYPYAFQGNEVLFGAARLDAAANRLYPTGYQPELYRVPVAGGRVRQLLTTPAEEVAVQPGGNAMLYQNKPSQENQWRKHQTSAATRNIWHYNPATGEHKAVTSFAGDDLDPVWAADGKGFYYLSEQSGNLNVHFQNADGSGSRQLTQFKKHPVRFLSMAANGTLCFGQAGDLYTLKPGGSPQKINISLATELRNNREMIMQVNRGSGLAVSPNGKEVAYLFRGDVFVSAVEGGLTRRITNTPATEAIVQFSPDGKKLVYGSERNGAWSIHQTTIVRKEEPYFYAATLLNEEALVANKNWNTQPLFSPDGKELAFIENRHHLRVLNLASKQSRQLLGPDQLFGFTQNDQDFKWSPDGKWILFEMSQRGVSPPEIGLVSADGKRIENLTQSGFSDFNPQWAFGGKAIVWQSNRDGLRAAAASGGSQTDVYALFLNQEAFDRYKLSKEELALQKDVDEAAAKADTTKKKANKDSILVIDWAGLPQRKQRLTTHSASLGDAVVSKDGETLYYLARFERGLNLWQTNLRTRETKMLIPLNAGGGSLAWDKEQKSLYLNADGAFSKIDPASSKQESIRLNGEMMADAVAERQQQLAHVWQRTKATFYTKDLHGAAWDDLLPDYERYAAQVGTNFEMSELLSELLGELNVSHSGSGYSASNPNGDATAALGIFLDESHEGNGVKIAEVLANGPLSKAGMNVVAGTIIESIDGQPIDHQTDWVALLNRKAGKPVLLRLRAPGAEPRDLVVKPIGLGEEGRLLYERWVRRNEAEVDKMSNGTLGYVHIPGMNDGAFRTTFEESMGKHIGKKALVVDTRNNGGGDLVADLATFLSGKKFMDYTTDDRSAGFEPNFRWNKPSISLANEANYSDGHCYAFTVKELGLGKLVGMPVPGTCTFAAWESLGDAGIRWGAPTVGCKDVRGNYLENNQTMPDILVANAPDQAAKGVDQQLERAVKELNK